MESLRTGVKQLVKRVAEPFRPHLAPSFLIVGAQKAGTSALFKALAAHPQLLAPEVKELDFFSVDENFNKDLDHYLGQFPLKPWSHKGERTFEASPSYLDSLTAPVRIHQLFPAMRIIIVLRDPVKRAYSAWNMYRQFAAHPRFSHRFDKRPFEVAIAENLSGGAGSGPIDDYLERGIYAPKVERYLREFGPSNVLVLSYLAYRNDPKGALDRVCDFLALDRFSLDDAAFLKKANKRPYDAAMPEALKEQLYRHFAPSMIELGKLLGPEADICEEQAYRHLWTVNGDGH